MPGSHGCLKSLVPAGMGAGPYQSSRSSLRSVYLSGFALWLQDWVSAAVPSRDLQRRTWSQQNSTLKLSWSTCTRSAVWVACSGPSQRPLSCRHYTSADSELFLKATTLGGSDSSLTCLSHQVAVTMMASTLTSAHWRTLQSMRWQPKQQV